jgi:hypothetical protein
MTSTKTATLSLVRDRWQTLFPLEGMGGPARLADLRRRLAP